ncbi:MAG: glycosyltransferase [Actinobacteria bacterium]|nr:glycosyltransferase [Actinomycetota bacterium]
MFPQISKKIPDSVLLVAGDSRLGEFSDYMDMLVKLINESEARDSIMFIKGKFSQERYDEIVCCADAAPLPYKITAQSGVMAHFLAYGIPLITSDLTVFTEKIKKFNFGFICRNNEEFFENIVKFLRNDKLRKSISNSIREYVNKNLLWEIVAKKTYKLYKNIKNIISLHTL